MKKEVVLVVDFGTSNVRVNAVGTADGTILYSKSKKYYIQNSGKGYQELRVNELWDYSVECMRSVTSDMEGECEAKAISFSFFGDNVIPVDESGVALNDCILAIDPRGVEASKEICKQIPREEQVDIIGASYDMPYMVGGKIYWMVRNMPELKGKRIFWYSQQQYIFRRLGIRPVNDYTMAARKCLADLSHLEWSKRFLDVIEISAESLGEIIGSGDVVDYVSAYGDVQFGKAIPVIAGAHDCDVGFIGTGAINEQFDYVGDITGTYDHVGYITNGVKNMQKIHPEMSFGSYHGPFVNSTVCLTAFPTAGATLEWFMREIHGGASAQDYLDCENGYAFDGTGSVMVLPNLSGYHGTIEGIGMTTTQGEIFGAIYEALSFENRKMIKECERTREVPFSRIRIGGGAANSTVWMQLRADISGKIVERVDNIQVSSLGAAVLGAVQAGTYTNVEEAVSKMVRIRDVFIPDRERHDRYQERYELYLKRMGYFTKEG